MPSENVVFPATRRYQPLGAKVTARPCSSCQFDGTVMRPKLFSSYVLKRASGTLGGGAVIAGASRGGAGIGSGFRSTGGGLTVDRGAGGRDAGGSPAGGP